MYVEIWSLELVRLRKKNPGSFWVAYSGSIKSSWPPLLATVELPGAYLTVSQLSTGLIGFIFLGNFIFVLPSDDKNKRDRFRYGHKKRICDDLTSYLSNVRKLTWVANK